MDQELIAYLDQRFRETSQQIEGLRQETSEQIAGLRQETSEQFAGLRQETSEQFAGLRQETSQQIAGLRQETSEQFAGLRQETSEQFTGLRQETSQQILDLREETVSRFQQSDSRFDGLEETIRHTQVAVEALRGEIRLVAEGVTGANERLDSFRTEVAKEFTETRQFIRVSYSDLDRRLHPLEGRMERRDQDPMDPL